MDNSTKQLNSLSDAQLISAYKSTRDKRHVGELFRRYSHLVSVLCMKYLKNTAASEDAAMEVFENLMKDLLNHDVKNFKAWLYSVTKNHCLKTLRKGKQVQFKEEIEVKTEPDIVEIEANLDQYNGTSLEGKLNRLEDSIQLLSTEQKECIELFYIKQKSYREVSETTGYTLKQVKSYIQNGKRNLHRYMTEEYG